MYDRDTPVLQIKESPYKVWDKNFSLEKEFKNAKVLAVRGVESRKRIKKSYIEVGDPGILCDMLTLKNREGATHKPLKLYDVGWLPHYVDQQEESFLFLSSMIKKRYGKFIDVMGKVGNVIYQIQECESIISSSLHGIIAADSFHIPNYWVQFSGKVGGGGFKFKDYQSGIEENGGIEETKQELLDCFPFKKDEILNHNAVH